MYIDMVVTLHQDWQETLANKRFAVGKNIQRSKFAEESSLLMRGTGMLQIKKAASSQVVDSSCRRFLPDTISRVSLFRREKTWGVFESSGTIADVFPACVLQPTSASSWPLWV